MMLRTHVDRLEVAYLVGNAWVAYTVLACKHQVVQVEAS